MKFTLALALLAVSTVKADVFVQTLPFNIEIINATNLNINPATIAQTLNFNQFNPALGTLTGVQYLLLNSTTTRNLTVTGSRNSGTVNSISVGTTTGTASLLGAPLVPVFLQTITATCSGNPSCTASPTASNNPTGTQSIGVLGGYIGLSTVGATLTLTAGRTLPLGTPLIAAGLSRSANIDATWVGDLQLTYTYTPAPVPEPSTWAMIGLSGMFLAGRSLRRKQ